MLGPASPLAFPAHAQDREIRTVTGPVLSRLARLGGGRARLPQRFRRGATDLRELQVPGHLRGAGRHRRRPDREGDRGAPHPGERGRMTREPMVRETTGATGTPLVEMEAISIAFGGIHAVEDASIDLQRGRGRRRARPQRGGQVDAHQDPVGRLQARRGHHPRGRRARRASTIHATPSHTASRRSTRRSRWPTTWTARPTSIWGANCSPPSARWTTSPWRRRRGKVMGRLNPRFPALQGAGDEAVGRPAPVGRHRARDPVQRAHPHHGRADRGAGARGDRAGGRAHRAAQEATASASSSSPTTSTTSSTSPTGWR